MHLNLSAKEARVCNSYLKFSVNARDWCTTTGDNILIISIGFAEQAIDLEHG